MSQYIRPENQTILWNTIQRVELFRRVLTTDSHQWEWFKEIVGWFYEENRNRRLTKHDLEQLNRRTIEHMILSLKKMASQNVPKKHVSFHESIGLDLSELEFSEFDKNPPQIRIPSAASSNLEKKSIQSQQYSNAFAARQQEYEQMTKRETPPEPNFKEELSDEIIRNMDELLERQKKQREEDMLLLQQAPLGIAPISPNIKKSTSSDKFRDRVLNIMKDSSLESVEIQELDSNIAISSSGQSLQTILENIQKEQTEIKTMLQNLTKLLYGPLAVVNTSPDSKIQQNSIEQNIENSLISKQSEDEK